MRQRVTVFGLSVCLCFSPILAPRAIRRTNSDYQQLQRDTGMGFKMGFLLKTLRSKVMASFTHLE